MDVDLYRSDSELIGLCSETSSAVVSNQSSNISRNLYHHVAPEGERAVRSVSESMFSKVRLHGSVPNTSSFDMHSAQEVQPLHQQFDFNEMHGETTMQLVTVVNEDGSTCIQMAGGAGMEQMGNTGGDDILYVEEVDMDALGQHPQGTILQGPNGETYVVSLGNNFGTSAAAAQAAGASGVIGAGGQFIELPAEQVQALLAEARPIKYVPNNGEGSVSYRCPQCPSFFINASAFTKHMKERHAAKVFVCRQCDAFYPSLSDLFLHARRSHVDVKKPRRNPEHFRFHCTECAYMTNNGGTFEAHQRAHSGEKPFICDICGKRFAQKANMKTHRTRHVERERPFVCDICHKAFTTNDIYLAHLRTREHELREHFQMMATSNLLLECLGCSTNFDSIYALKKHTRSCKIVRTLVTKFRCLPCNAYLAELLDLKNHVKGHDGQQVGVIGCPVCGERGFPGFNQLNHHITRAHALRVARRHVCRYCMESFESKEEMQVHVEEAHTEEKAVRGPRAGPFFCKYRGCNYISEEKNDLVKHHSLHAMNRDDVDQTLIKTRPANFYAYSEEDVNPPKRRRGRPRKNHFAFTPVQEMALAQAGVQVRRGRGRPAGTQQSRIQFMGPEDMSSENSFSDDEGSTEDEEGNWKPPARLANEPVPPREPAGPPDQRLPSPPPKSSSKASRGGGTSSGRGRGLGYSSSTSFAAQFAQNQQNETSSKRLPAWFVGRQSASAARRVVPTALSGATAEDEDYKPPAHYLVHETRDRQSMVSTAGQPQELTVEFVNAGNDEGDFIAASTTASSSTRVTLTDGSILDADDVMHRFIESGDIQAEMNSSHVVLVDSYMQH